VRLDNRTFNLILFRTMPIASTFRPAAGRLTSVVRTFTVLRRARSERGFTMMELLVVLAILGLLAGLAISNIGGIFGGAQAKTAELFVKESMKAPLFTYRMHMGDYPSTADGLQALITAPGAKASSWHGPYITEARIPNDPWGEQYQYAYPGQKNKTGYDLWSKGPDKQSGTADDVGNWDAAANDAK
jgi:general secretion pathway protein G